MPRGRRGRRQRFDTAISFHLDHATVDAMKSIADLRNVDFSVVYREAFEQYVSRFHSVNETTAAVKEEATASSELAAA